MRAKKAKALRRAVRAIVQTRFEQYGKLTAPLSYFVKNGSLWVCPDTFRGIYLYLKKTS